ncbi:MAG: DUF3726 domain-containing protein [Pseudomonadota bacterium]
MSSRTLSEITATCTKAARSAGCPWGMAEEAGAAARILSAHGLPGAEALASLLGNPRRCGCNPDAQAPDCAIARLAALLDAPPSDTVEFDAVAAPLLLLGFALIDTGAWTLEWNGGYAVVDAQGLQVTGDLPPDIAKVTVRKGGATKGQPRMADWRSQPVDPKAWCNLEVLADRLLVPESEQSRVAGAGPGTQKDE